MCSTNAAMWQQKLRDNLNVEYFAQLSSSKYLNSRHQIVRTQLKIISDFVDQIFDETLLRIEQVMAETWTVSSFGMFEIRVRDSENKIIYTFNLGLNSSYNYDTNDTRLVDVDLAAKSSHGPYLTALFNTLCHLNYQDAQAGTIDKEVQTLCRNLVVLLQVDVDVIEKVLLLLEISNSDLTLTELQAMIDTVMG